MYNDYLAGYSDPGDHAHEGGYSVTLDTELEDFDSAPFAKVKHSDHHYLKGMWNGFRATSKDLAQDTVMAHGMVQAFVNAFARDGKYESSMELAS